MREKAESKADALMRTPPMAKARAIAAHIAQLRRARGESQVAVCRRAGTNNSQLSRFEAGLCAVGLDWLLSLLEALDQELVIVPSSELNKGRRYVTVKVKRL